MAKPVYLSWVEVGDIRVTNDATPSPATIRQTVDKLGRETEKRTTLVVRPLGDPAGSPSFELVTGRREYEASRQLGRTLIPCRIVEFTSEQAAALRRLDVLMEPRAANDLIRGWELIDSADQHEWDRADLTSFLPAGRSQVGDAWNAAEALPKADVVARCRADDVPVDAVSELTRAHIRRLRNLSDDERLNVLMDHLQPSDASGSVLDSEPTDTGEPEVDELFAALAERLRQCPWTQRAAYVVRLAGTLLRRS